MNLSEELRMEAEFELNSNPDSSALMVKAAARLDFLEAKRIDSVKLLTEAADLIIAYSEAASKDAITIHGLVIGPKPTGCCMDAPAVVSQREGLDGPNA